MTGILSLPPELIRALGIELRAERKVLRTTCRYINESLAPVVLSSLAINLPGRAASTLALLDALAERSQKTDHWRCSVRSLKVVAFCPTRTRPWRNQLPGLDHCLSHLRDKLKPAIASLTGLYRVVWNVGQSDEPDWLHDAFIAGLAALPLLQGLDVNILYSRRTWDMRLARISTLTSLKFTLDQRSPYYRCSDSSAAELILVTRTIACNPNLRRLDVCLMRNCPRVPDSTVSLDDLLNDRRQYASPSTPLRHLVLAGVTPIISQPNLCQLRCLKSISIECDLRHAADLDNLWQLLQKEQIYLEGVITNRVTQSLTRYLESYEGLVCLELLAGTHHSPPEQQEDTATSFLRKVLQNHFRTLRRLILRAIHDSRWCVTLETIRNICKCVELRYLGVFVDATTDLESSGLESHIGAIITTIAIKMEKLTTLQIDAIRDYPSKDHHISSFSALMLSMHAKEHIQTHILKYRSEPRIRRLPDIRQGRRLFYGVRCVEGGRDENRMRYVEATSDI